MPCLTQLDTFLRSKFGNKQRKNDSYQFFFSYFFKDFTEAILVGEIMIVCKTPGSEGKKGECRTLPQ